MLTNVLVPLDGSILAERALSLATRLVGAAPGCTLTLVRAHMPFQSAPLLGMATVDAAIRQDREAFQEAEAYLERVSARLKGEGFPVTAFVHKGGASEVILAAAEAHAASAIVMSTHGRGGLARWVYGSVADDVLRHAKTPVLLVATGADRAWPTGRPARILVPLDGSELAETALTPARELAATLGADLVLLRVVDLHVYAYAEGYVYDEADAEAERQEALAYIEEVAERIKREAQLLVKTVVDTGPVARVIADTARTHEVDLIAMATHGRGGLSRLVLGSAATGTLRWAHLPLLVVRPRPDAAAAPVVLGQVVSVPFSPGELDLVRRGLEELLAGEYPVEPVRSLLDRLDQVVGAPASPEKGG